MKAAVYRRYGSPGVVSVDDVPKPAPRDDEGRGRRYGIGASPGTATKMENRSKLASRTGYPM